MISISARSDRFKVELPLSGLLVINFYDSVAGKVMFLHLSVILSTKRGGAGVVVQRGVVWYREVVYRGVWYRGGCLQGQTPLGRHPQRNSHCRDPYASSWNTFLLLRYLNSIKGWLLQML